MINRRHLAAASFAFGVSALAFAMPASAQTKWNLPAAYPSDNPHSENLVLFAKDVEAATAGKLQITVHPNASLFKAPEIKRAVASGQAQMGEVLMSIHENEDPVFGIDVVPFLATSFADSKKLYAASKAAVEKKLDSQGIKLLFMVPWAPQGVYPCEGKEQWLALSVRSDAEWRAFCEAMGAAEWAAWPAEQRRASGARLPPRRSPTSASTRWWSGRTAARTGGATLRTF